MTTAACSSGTSGGDYDDGATPSPTPTAAGVIGGATQKALRITWGQPIPKP